MEDKVAVAHMYEDAEVFQSSILEARQMEHAEEVRAAEERARLLHKQKKVGCSSLHQATSLPNVSSPLASKLVTFRLYAAPAFSRFSNRYLLSCTLFHFLIV